MAASVTDYPFLTELHEMAAGLTDRKARRCRQWSLPGRPADRLDLEVRTSSE